MRWLFWTKRALLPSLLLAMACAAHGESCDVHETFDGGFHEVWQLTDPTAVGVVGDVLKVQFTGASNRDEHAVLDRCVFGDMTLQLRLRDLDETRGKVVEFARRDDFEGYGVNFRSAPFNDAVLAYGANDQPATILAVASVPHLSGQWLQVELRVVGQQIEVDVDGVNVIAFDATGFPQARGWLSLGGNAGGTQSAHMEFDDLSISSMDAIGTLVSSWGSLKGRYE